MQKFMQVKNYLLELSFLALLVKFLFFGTEIGIALAIISLVISMAYNKWLAKAKLEQYEELVNQMKSDKEALEAKMIADKAELNERIDLAFGKIGNLSLDSSVRNVVTSEKTQKFQAPSRRF